KFAVVPQVDLDLAGHAGSVRSLAREDGVVGHVSHCANQCTALGGPNRKLTPACADLQESRPSVNAGEIQQPVDLPALRFGQRAFLREYMAIIAGREDRRGVAHRLIKERPKQLIGQGIMVVGIAPRTLYGLLFGRWAPGSSGVTAHPLQPRWDECVGSCREDGQKARQVVAVPVPDLECLAKTNQSAGAESPVERLRPG